MQPQIVDQVYPGDQAHELLAVQHDGHAVPVEDRDQVVQSLLDLERVELGRHGAADRLGETRLATDLVRIQNMHDVAVVKNADRAAHPA
jgi:hypothetical protein